MTKYSTPTPKSIAIKHKKLHTSRPAPTDNIRASANCTTTSDPSSRCRAQPAVTLCVPSLSTLNMDPIAARSAGIAPNNSNITKNNTTINNTTRTSIAINSAHNNIVPTNTSSTRIPQNTSSSPSTPPITTNTTPSV